jgi:hypothetical protein
MEMNIYWNDLTLEGKASLLDSGFTPTAEQVEEDEPIGVIHLDEEK